jgi:hypothetical protein
MSKSSGYYSITDEYCNRSLWGGAVKTQLLTTLTLAVTGVLLALLNSQTTSGMIELIVLIVLVVLIMVVGGAQQELPKVLRTILGFFRRK